MGAKQRVLAAISSRTAAEVVAVAVSASISAAVTYRIASKRIEAAYAAKIDQELSDTRKFFEALNERPTPAEMVAEVGLEPITQDEPVEPPADPRPTLNITGQDQRVAYNNLAGGYQSNADGPAIELNLVVKPPAGEPEEVEIVRNVFDQQSSDNLDQEEIDARGPDRPYIITIDEFNDGLPGQDTLTYYADDGVLADSQDMPLDDVEGMVGTENLLHFGKGSGDSKVLYVRNEKMDQDWEIVVNEGNYGEIVHGITKESSPRKRRSTSTED